MSSAYDQIYAAYQGASKHRDELKARVAELETLLRRTGAWPCIDANADDGDDEYLECRWCFGHTHSRGETEVPHWPSCELVLHAIVAADSASKTPEASPNGIAESANKSGGEVPGARPSEAGVCICTPADHCSVCREGKRLRTTEAPKPEPFSLSKAAKEWLASRCFDGSTTVGGVSDLQSLILLLSRVHNQAVALGPRPHPCTDYPLHHTDLTRELLEILTGRDHGHLPGSLPRIARERMAELETLRQRTETPRVDHSCDFVAMLAWLRSYATQEERGCGDNHPVWVEAHLTEKEAGDLADILASKPWTMPTGSEGKP